MAIVAALVILALAAATVLAAVLSSGGDDKPANSASQPQVDAGKAKKKKQDKPKKKEPQAQEQEAEPAPAPAEPAPEEPAPQEPAAPTGGSGSDLNAQGFQLMQQGDYAGAVPILQKAVAAWPEDSTDLEYAYALFNLGKSLNRSGSPDEAIPYLEKRLNWDDQTETVQAELDLARENAKND